MFSFILRLLSFIALLLLGFQAISFADTRYFYDQHNSNPGDCEWTNANNWYVDADMNTPLGGPAISSDNVVVLPGSCLNATHNDTASWTFPASLDAGSNSLEFWYGTSFPITTTGNVSFTGGPGSSTSVTSPISADSIHFDGYTSNDSTLTVSSNAIFSQYGGNSSNNGTINGNALFYNSSSNAGTINGDATFYENTSENTGTITGTKTRHYTQAITTTRDFYTDGPWTVIADGVAVDVSGADYDSNTTFTTQNGGSFVGLDQTQPHILSVSSDKANGTYGAGETIDIDVTFSEIVTSTGNITVTLETGTTDRTCTFTVTNSTTGTCNYVVQVGDLSSDLNVTSISGLMTDTHRNVTDGSGGISIDANLASNKALVIYAVSDTTGPIHSNMVISTTDKTATLNFNTDESATSELSYQKGKKGKIVIIPVSRKLISNHSVTLKNLDTCSSYSYILTNKDKLGNTTTTLITFTTKGEKNKKGLYQPCKRIKEGN